MKSVILFLSVIYVSINIFAGVFLEPIEGSAHVFRGRSPKAYEIQQMVNSGINSVLIIKNQTKNEVDEEIALLIEAGISPEKIYHIPLLWKDIISEVETCEHILTAIGILQKAEVSSEDKILFHCTVGEDRTGLVAGLFYQLLNQKSTDESYKTQMCKKGYAGGNYRKPKNVAALVDQNLTPLYFKISKLIQEGEINFSNIDASICKNISDIDVSTTLKTCKQMK
jgi:protein-tyrosine phosphatase